MGTHLRLFYALSLSITLVSLRDEQLAVFTVKVEIIPLVTSSLFPNSNLERSA